jgi:hypothetical protein
VLALGAETSRLAATHPETALGGGAHGKAPWMSTWSSGRAVLAVAYDLQVFTVVGKPRGRSARPNATRRASSSPWVYAAVPSG